MTQKQLDFQILKYELETKQLAFEEVRFGNYTRAMEILKIGRENANKYRAAQYKTIYGGIYDR